MKFSKETILTYIQPRVSLSVSTGCWEWIKRKDRNGYASMDYKDDTNRWRVACNLHRIVFQAFNGDIADSSLVVSHKCNNRGCINPDHLELTTQKQNVAEQIRQCTHASQIKVRNRLSNEDRDDIFTRLLNDESCYSIAKRHNRTISAISLYRRHLPAWLAKKAKREQVNVTITETLTIKEVE